jgi:membrane protein implicated in regulation of membrane protease activity
MDWLSDNVWAAWLAAAGVLAAAEMLGADLILIMLAAGAVVGAVAALLSAPLFLQVLLAAGTAMGALVLVRPNLVARLHTGPDLVLGPAKLVGTQGVVTQAMTPVQPGRVELDGDIWTAVPYDGDVTAIAVGERVEVREIKGATAYVDPVPYRPS